MKRSIPLVFASLLAASSVAACAGILGFDRLELGTEANEAGSEAGVPVDGGDGGNDAAIDGSVPGCDEIGVPAKPGTTSQNQLPTFFMAFDLFDLGVSVDGGAPQIVGFNLDSTCTTSTATSSCIPTGGSAQVDNATPPGMDNVGSKLIAIPGASSPFSPQSIADALRAGKFGALMSVDFYNGEADDDDVKINIYPAIGVIGGGAPSFTEADRWVRDRDYNVGGGVSQFHANGYVSGGRLVVQFDEITFNVPLGETGDSVLSLHLTGVVLGATFEKGEDGGVNFHLRDGAMAGRWSLTEMLGAIGTIDDGSGAGVCDSTIYGPLVKGAICESADLAATPGEDVNAAAAAAGATKVPCAAISVGARFSTYYVGDDDNDAKRAVGTVHTCDAGYSQCE